jgi:hypothetical protein
MPHIPYADPASITDPKILGYLELARKEGTPRGGEPSDPSQ